MAITKKQTAIIHVAKKQLHLDDEAYRAILQKIAKVSSSSELSDKSFRTLMKHFETLGFQSTNPDFKARNRNMATQQQINFIEGLWQDYTDGCGTPFTLGRWLERTFKVSHARFLTKYKAQKAITALKAMNRRQ